MIYLNHIETTQPKPQPVIDAVVRAMTTMGNASRGTHDSALQASQTVYQTRKKLADFFGCPRPDHVIFTSGGTDALNIALKGTLSGSCHVVLTSVSYCAIIDEMNRTSDSCHISYDLIPDDTPWKDIRYNISTRIRPDTCAIICSHDCRLTGNLYDLRQIGKLAREKHLLFIADVSRSAGLYPVHMEESFIDILCCSGHKSLMGPQGTGILCVRPGVEIRPFKHGGSGVQSYKKTQPSEYPARLEAGTLNGHGIAGISAVLDYITKTDMEKIRQSELDLMYRFYHGISGQPAITVYGNYYSVPRLPLVNLNMEGIPAEDLTDRLYRYHGIKAGIVTGTSVSGIDPTTASASKVTAASFSFSHFNTQEETEHVIQTLLAIAGQ